MSNRITLTHLRTECAGGSRKIEVEADDILSIENLRTAYPCNRHATPGRTDSPVADQTFVTVRVRGGKPSTRHDTYPRYEVAESQDEILAQVEATDEVSA